MPPANFSPTVYVSLKELYKVVLSLALTSEPSDVYRLKGRVSVYHFDDPIKLTPFSHF